MTFHEIKKNLPTPSKSSIEDLIWKISGGMKEVPDWVRDAITVAYQNGRYDEASAETFAAAFI